MPEEGVALRPKPEFMTTEETIAIAKTFVDLGVNKIRITGGEPLIKKDIDNILTQLAALGADLYMTTNGILVGKYLPLFKKVGLKNINVSLDSLKEEKFNAISKRQYFGRIMQNIDLLVSHQFNVKINVVLMKDVNDDEIIDFIEWTKDKPVSVRFIEFMPFDGNQWDTSKVVSFNSIMDQVQNHFPFAAINPLKGQLNDTSKNFKIANYKGDFGIISSVTNPFCDGCNRIRLTADGKLKNCLFSAEETDLLTAFRAEKPIIPLIEASIKAKHFSRAGIDGFTDENIKNFEQNRNMTAIGG